jgi:DNA-binding NtrC family response regulator
MKIECKRILILDTDTIGVYRLFSVLIRDGFTVETSCSIREAVERIKDVKFDCVVMDVNLPKIKGYDAVSILKAIDPNVKIIMTSEKNDIQLETEVRKQDIAYYHIKSFDHMELVEAVRDVCNK